MTSSGGPSGGKLHAIYDPTPVPSERQSTATATIMQIGACLPTATHGVI